MRNKVYIYGNERISLQQNTKKINFYKRKTYRGIVTDIRAQEEEIEKLEQKREEYLASDKEPSEEEKKKEEEKKDEKLSAEEGVWKGRYGEGRRYQQKLLDENKLLKDKHEEELEALRKEQPQPALPATEEEMSDFMEKAPHAAKVIESLIIKKARELNKSFDKRIKKVEDGRVELKQDQAKFKLEKIHPDIDEINMSSEFKEWIKNQSDAIQDALFKGLDAEQASSIIDWFKSDVSWKAKKKIDVKKEEEEKAAEAVSAKGKAQHDLKKDKEIIFASDVAKMSSNEYEKNMKKIDKARKEGKFVQDI